MRVRWTAMEGSIRASSAVLDAPTMTGVDVIRVAGGVPLRGTVEVSGAKNSALKLMAVSLLAEGETVISNVPKITDILIMAEVLRRLGCEASFVDGVVRVVTPAQPGAEAD